MITQIVRATQMSKYLEKTEDSESRHVLRCAHRLEADEWNLHRQYGGKAIEGGVSNEKTR